MISPNDEQGFNKIAYNNYELCRKIPKTIVDYLFDNCPDFWKLLRYSQEPLSKKDLTAKEKKDMICKDPFKTEEFNVLFQKYTVNAMIKAKSQVRVFIDDITSYGRTNALVRIVFQIVVNNNEMIINTPYSPVDKRDVAIMQTLVDALNGVKLVGMKSQIFINVEQDRYSGAQQVSYNNDYSGFQLSMAVWI